MSSSAEGISPPGAKRTSGTSPAMDAKLLAQTRVSEYDMRDLRTPSPTCEASEAVSSPLEVESLRAKVRELEAKLLEANQAAQGENVLMQQYLEASACSTLRGRLPWLVVLLLIQSTAALVMSSFEELLNQELVIAFFVPMIVGTGGNAGNQPGVAVTRALALGNVSTRTLRRIVLREAGLGLATASALTIVGFLRVVVEYPEDLRAAAAISLAVFAMVNLAILLGVGFSITMDRLSIDPANGAAPMLTTLTDLIGITMLCGISAAFYGIGPG